MNIVKIQISHSQRGMIYGLAKDLGIDNAALHEYMLAWADVSSLKSDVCSRSQAIIIIDCLNKLKNPAKKIGNRGTITDKQIDAIEKIKGSYAWSDSRLLGFIKHTLSVDELESVESIDHIQASRVITGLKKMGYTKKDLTKK